MGRTKRMKDLFMIVLIMAFAIVSTYYIYHNFRQQRSMEIETDTLSVTFHERSGDRVNIRRITPVRDSVGLSSTAYTFTVRNDSKLSSMYKIEIVDDLEGILNDGDILEQIPHDMIRVSISRRGERTEIFYLSELEETEILNNIIGPEEEIHYTMRFWISENAILNGVNIHYNGMIRVTLIN